MSERRRCRVCGGDAGWNLHNVCAPCNEAWLESPEHARPLTEEYLSSTIAYFNGPFEEWVQRARRERRRR